jgi:hypothetical protein
MASFLVDVGNTARDQTINSSPSSSGRARRKYSGASRKVSLTRRLNEFWRIVGVRRAEKQLERPRFLNEREGGTMTPEDIDWLLVYPLVK